MTNPLRFLIFMRTVMRNLNKLNEYEKQFLKDNNLKALHVFDATKIFSAKEWRAQIKNTDCEVALCTTACTKSKDHRLKLKSGHCALCNLRGLAHQISYRKSGDIYVVYSKKLGLVKVGRSEKTGIGDERVVSLNRQAYGGAKDWELQWSTTVVKAGEVESEIHGLLAAYSVDGLQYRKGSTVTVCREVFNCTTQYALRITKKVIRQSERRLSEG